MKLPLRSYRYLAAFEARRLPHVFADVLVIGSGAAGLRAAIEAARSADVLVLAKRGLADTNTVLAQGGIAAALGPEDSPEAHARDTVASGRGLCDEGAVVEFAREAPDRIRELLGWGANFDREGGGLALAREGGHGAARLARARGDATGAEIQDVLLREARHSPRLRFLEGLFAVDLLSVDGRCAGALVLRKGQGLAVVRAAATVLATGGAGRLFRETTNPPGACGDGLAMAWRAGAALRDLEFVQFHPTALYLAGAPRFLISEAARGAGGVLLDARGRRFMTDLDPKAELAPRDVVARGITAAIKETAGNCVYLDLRNLREGRARDRFPGIAAVLAGYGIDIEQDRIPVRPAAHYMIGGVETDLRGATRVPGLFAAGEVASTGLHGANRLGSNSLIEGLVFGRRAGAAAAELAASHPNPEALLDITSPERGKDRLSPEILLEDLENSLVSLMWRAVGLERDEASLMEAVERIAFWSGYVLPRRFRSVRGLVFQNLLQVARLVALGALRRRESRGAHFRTDFPEEKAEWRRPNPCEAFQQEG